MGHMEALSAEVCSECSAVKFYLALTRAKLCTKAVTVTLFATDNFQNLYGSGSQILVRGFFFFFRTWLRLSFDLFRSKLGLFETLLDPGLVLV